MEKLTPQQLKVIDEIGKLAGEMVRCCDCKHSQHLQPKESQFGLPQRDLYCTKSLNGTTLLNGLRNKQALNVRRFCDGYEPWDGRSQK